VKVAMIGKIKTTVQMIALLCLLYSVTPGYTRTGEIWLGVPLFHPATGWRLPRC
jgi:CDP-diacylglycerol--glycerol-3-phosphate 3-phosphatidyltransferase